MPDIKVLEIFEEVQRRHRQGQTNPGFEDDVTILHTEREEDNTTESGRGTGSSTPSASSSEGSPVLRNGS